MSDRLAAVRSQPRSVSQLLTYRACPQEYFLERVALDIFGRRIWQRPAAWFPMGTAVHAAAEAFELHDRTMSLEDMNEVFTETYTTDVRKYLDRGTMDTWFHSGRYGGEEDIERRFKVGLEHVARYRKYYTEGSGASQQIVWLGPDSERTRVVELPFDVRIGEVRVKGFIDAAVHHGDFVVVRDNKTGAKPGNPFQLATYGVALKLQYGVTAHYGDFFMTKTGKPTGVIDLSEWPEERVAAEFEALELGIGEGRFTATPEASMCSRCSVNAYCDFVAF